MSVAVVTIAHGRHRHLLLQLASLMVGARRPDHHVVVAMNDRGIGSCVAGHPLHPDVVEIETEGAELPLARARNRGVEHSQQEHLEADRIAERLSALDPESQEFSEVLEELIEGVTHHMEEEEETVLPHMRERMDAETLSKLGERFLAARAEHLGDQPDDITKEQLEQQAENVELRGASGMGKQELKEELESRAEA
jgi:transcription termination factor NusB